MKRFNSISFLAFLIVLYVARNAVPYAIYPLMLLLFPFALYQFVNIKEAKQSRVKSVKVFSPVIVLIVIELVAIFCTVYPFNGLPLNFLKEITFISVFLFLLSYHIKSKDDFMLLIEKIGKYFILFAIVISVLGLWKFFYFPSFISSYYLDGNLRYKWGSSLVSDYNFFALFLLNGLFFGLYKMLCHPVKIKYKGLFLTALQLIIATAILSGSRRLMLCLSGLFLGNLLLLIPFLFSKIFLKSSYKYLCLFLLSSMVNLGVIYSFLSYFPLISEKAEKTLFIDSKNLNYSILSISTRINSATSYYLIDIHKKEKLLARIHNEQSNTNMETNETVSIVLEKTSKTDEIVPLTESRQTLWILGKNTYNEYTVVQKIVGRGFTFLDIFQKETKIHFYPHHLFLSVLLFSGIIGLIIYIAVLLWSSIIYLFHLKKLGILFFLFIINFIFGFFSFTDFFGATFYAILIILPMLYRYLCKYEKTITIQTP